VGGYKEIIMKVSGNKVYGSLNMSLVCTAYNGFRKPKRRAVIHTSAATVAVLPEAGEFDIELNMNTFVKTHSAHLALADNR
jgi:peptide chain release factor 1